METAGVNARATSLVTAYNAAGVQGLGPVGPKGEWPPEAARPPVPCQGVIASVRTIAAACSRQVLAGAARQVNVTW